MATGGPLQLVELDVGGSRVGLEIGVVRQILRAGRPAPLPGAPALVEGVLDLGGAVVPVADLARVLGGPADPAAARLVVADLDGHVVGLRVAGALDVVRADPDRVSPAPASAPGAAAPLIRALVRRAGGPPLPVLSPAGLLGRIAAEPASPGLSSAPDPGAQHSARTADEPSR